jgi:hypothetical protein
MPKPISVSIDVPQPRVDVFAFLDVMANHEPFTDHMLVDWSCSGPPSGVGSKAHVFSDLAGRKEAVDIEVVSAEVPARITERNVSAKGARVATGTYDLAELPARRHAHLVHLRLGAGAARRPPAVTAGAHDPAQRQRAGAGAAGRAAAGAQPARSSTSVMSPHAGNGEV